MRSSLALRGESRNKGNGIVLVGDGTVFVGGEFAGEAAFGSPPLRSDRRAPDGFVARLSSLDSQDILRITSTSTMENTQPILFAHHPFPPT